MAIRTRQELYEIIKNEITTTDSSLTDFEEGSILDAITGASSTAISEAIDLLIQQFNKTYIDLAQGPEETGGDDDLQTLAVDQYGDAFARPEPSKAIGVVTFSRPTSGAGDVSILAGTIVKTSTDANGGSQRFTTLLDVKMVGLTINASIQAVEVGPKGNVDSGKVSVIETTLTDPTVVVANSDPTSGGANQLDTETYRQRIKNMIAQLQGATSAAIVAKALSVPGVASAKPAEFIQRVIGYNPAAGTTFGESFLIVRSKLYIADVNGAANDALVALVQSEISKVKAAGVRVEVIGAVGASLDWTAAVILNPSGPNYSVLQSDLSLIEETMKIYVNAIPIGDGFSKAAADAAILSVWGPAASNDLVSFSTTLPAGSIAGAEGFKLIPGTVTTG